MNRESALRIAACMLLLACHRPTEELVSADNSYKTRLAKCQQELNEHKAAVEVTREWGDQLAAALQEADEALANAEAEEPGLVEATRGIEQEGVAVRNLPETVLERIARLKTRLDNAHAGIERQQRAYDKELAQNKVLRTVLAGRESALRAKVARIIELETSLKSTLEALKVAEGLAKQSQEETAKEREQRELVAKENIELDRALYTGHYVVMPEEELIKSGLVTRNKVWLTTRYQLAKFPIEKFESIDIRQHTEIHLDHPREKLGVLSEHPRASYTFDSDPSNGAQSLLKIRDPEAFWSCRFLVIAIKR